METEMNELLDILIEHFDSKNEVEVFNQLRALQEKLQEESPEPTETTEELEIGKPARLKQVHWSHSRGLRGTVGTLTKINMKTVKIKFPGHPRPWGVPRHWAEMVTT